MKKTFIITLFAFVGTICCNAQIDKIVGDWITVDDNTGQDMSVVHIYKAKDGKYYGKITQLLVPGHENELCVECKGADKDKPIKGMIIIRGMEEKNGELVNGTILDPDNGKTYYAKISYDKDKNQLKLRGSLDKAGVLGRSQYWKKK